MKKRLLKALEACAKAHNVPFWHSKDMVTITGISVPTLSDVQTIVDAFYGRHNHVCTDPFFDSIDVYLEDYPMLDKVDKALLKAVFPEGIPA